jgi:bifunctional DNA-binding transcriptional regulator/antitoxin component of YhaV-PrlF toxin-antitoxin module
MIAEIKGRELTATYHQGRLYIPKPFRDMFGLKDNDILVIKIVEHTRNYKKRNTPNKNMDKDKEKTPSHIPQNGIDLEVPNLMDDKFPTPGPIRVGNGDDEE